MASGIEFDVQLTRDGVPVIFHDHETERLTGQSGTIVERTWSDVSELRSQGERIVQLSELGDAIAGLERRVSILNIEFKPTSRVTELIDATTPFFAQISALAGVELIVSSFDPRIIAAVLKMRPSWRVAYLYEDLTALDALKFFPPLPRSLDLHPKHNLLTEEHLEEYGEPQRTFRTWTVDEPVEALRILGLGVTQIITNNPNDLAEKIEGSPKT